MGPPRLQRCSQRKGAHAAGTEAGRVLARGPSSLAARLARSRGVAPDFSCHPAVHPNPMLRGYGRFSRVSLTRGQPEAGERSLPPRGYSNRLPCTTRTITPQPEPQRSGYREGGCPRDVSRSTWPSHDPGGSQAHPAPWPAKVGGAYAGQESPGEGAGPKEECGSP
jgi:hypothetical protein